jgi:hypothetical protein
MLDVLAVFVERHHIGDGLFLTLIAAQDKLKFDTHTGASPGGSVAKLGFGGKIRKSGLGKSMACELQLSCFR